MKPKSKIDLGNKADRLNTRPVEGNDRFNINHHTNKHFALAIFSSEYSH